MKRMYSAPKMEISNFQAEDIMTLSGVFAGFSATYDNEGNWKHTEWNINGYEV